MRLRLAESYRALVVITGIGLLPFRASALTPLTTATFAVSGIITEVTSDPGALDASVHKGSPYTALFRVDGPGADLYDYDPHTYGYIDRNPANAAEIRFGDYALGPGDSSTGLHSVGGYNLGSRPNLYAWESYGSQGSGIENGYAQVRLTDSTGTALGAKGFPPSGPGVSDISRWDYTDFWFRGQVAATGQRVAWTGKVDAISTSVIPEPGSLYLLGTVLLPLSTLARRWRPRR